jgi:hypothetical protein
MVAVGVLEKDGEASAYWQKLHMQERDAAISRSWYAAWMVGRGW